MNPNNSEIFRSITTLELKTSPNDSVRLRLQSELVKEKFSFRLNPSVNEMSFRMTGAIRELIPNDSLESYSVQMIP